MTKQCIATAALLAFHIALGNAQQPGSFFPSHTGDRWDYEDLNTGQILTMILTNDSIGVDRSHYLFYNDAVNPTYRIDTLDDVYWAPAEAWGNWLRYKLAADSCVSWESPPYGWAWVASVESTSVFSRATAAKLFRYAPGYPCNPGSLEEHRLASGFGLIWSWLEPNDIRVLRGCIINADTFGILTSVPQSKEPPRAYILKQNYPNPFNPSTTIEFELPEPAPVSIRVYGLLGNCITTLTDGMHLAGTHRVKWDACNLTSGVYLVQLRTPHTLQVKKAILIR